MVLIGRDGMKRFMQQSAVGWGLLLPVLYVHTQTHNEALPTPTHISKHKNENLPKPTASLPTKPSLVWCLIETGYMDLPPPSSSSSSSSLQYISVQCWYVATKLHILPVH